MNSYWGGEEDKPAEVAAITPVAEPTLVAEPVLDAQQQFLQELEKVGIDTKAAGFGEAVGQLSTGDLTNRELPGRIDALEKELEALPADKLIAFTGGQGVPQPVVNALVQARIAEERAKSMLSGMGGATMATAPAVGVLGLGALSLASGAAAAEMQPAQRSADVWLNDPVIASENTPQEIAAKEAKIKEKAVKGQDGGLSKIMEVVMALLSGKGLNGLFGGDKAQEVAQNAPDTSNPTKVGGMAAVPEQAKNPVAPQLKLAVSNALPASPSVNMSRADLGDVMPLPTPAAGMAIAQQRNAGAGAGRAV